MVRFIRLLTLLLFTVAATGVYASSPIKIELEEGQEYKVSFDKNIHHSLKAVFVNKFDGESNVTVSLLKEGEVLTEGQIGTEEYRMITLLKKYFILERAWHTIEADEFSFKVLTGKVKLKIYFINN